MPHDQVRKRIRLKTQKLIESFDLWNQWIKVGQSLVGLKREGYPVTKFSLPRFEPDIELKLRAATVVKGVVIKDGLGMKYAVVRQTFFMFEVFPKFLKAAD